MKLTLSKKLLRRWTALLLSLAMLFALIPPFQVASASGNATQEDQEIVLPSIIPVKNDNVETITESTYGSEDEGAVLLMADNRVQPPLLGDGSLDYAALTPKPKVTYANGTDFSNNLGLLTDNNLGTQIGEAQWSLSFLIDFGENTRISAHSIAMQARSGQLSRITGAKVQVSNNGAVWSDLHDGVASAVSEMQSFNAKTEHEARYYRYFKVSAVGNNGYFNISELRIFGDVQAVEYANNAQVSMTSSNVDPSIAVSGDAVRVEVAADVMIEDVEIVFYDTARFDALGTTDAYKLPVVQSDASGKKWIGTYVVDDYDYGGTIRFTVLYKDENGKFGFYQAPTAGSVVTIQKGFGYLDFAKLDFMKIALSSGENIYGESSWNSMASKSQAALLFDRDVLTSSQHQHWNGHQGSISFDMGEGNTVAVDSVQIMPRYDQVSRLNGTLVQGSNDLSTWTTITSTATNVGQKWQTMNGIRNTESYRYIRITNSSAWYMNIGEVQIFGGIRKADEPFFYTLDANLLNAQKIEAKGQLNFTDQSWLAFVNVIANAKSLRTDAEASQAAIDAMAIALLAAIQGLSEPLPTFINNTDTELVHPAISQTPEQLLFVREQIQNKQEPWYSFYQKFAASNYASKTYAIANDADPSADMDHLVPKYDYGSYSTSLFNNGMTNDAKAAYYQSIMYFMTGDAAYREKALRIIRLWSDLDPAKAVYVVDAHIHQGPPMYFMNAAAELLRYTSTIYEELEWKVEYTESYVKNFLEPALRIWMETKTSFFNQHQTAVMGTLSSYIFMDKKADYERVLEWATVNASTPEESKFHNGAIANAMYEFSIDHLGHVLDKPLVAVKEMYRDQPHAFGNVEGMMILAHIIAAQGTQLDPVKGTATNAVSGVDIFSFLDDRLVKGANYYYQYNLGYQPAYNDGRNTPLSTDRRGRLYGREDIYYIYKYTKGYTDSDPDFKYVVEALHRTWDVYGMPANDQWLYIPASAAGTDTPKAVVAENGNSVPYQFETRFTDLGNNLTKENDYIHVKATEVGSEFAVYGANMWRNGDLALRVRSNAISTLTLHADRGTEPFMKVSLPDTNGEWKYVGINLTKVTGFAADSIIYFTITGDIGGYVDFDHILLNSPTVKAPVFKDTMNSVQLTTYPGAEFQFDISNAAGNAGQLLVYTLDEDEIGLTVNANGVLSGSIPEGIESGDYKVYAIASNAVAMSVLQINLTIKDSYTKAIESVIASYDPAIAYETQSHNVFKAVYEAALALNPTGTHIEKNLALLDLKEAVSALRLLNPLLSDGALHLLGIAVGAPDSAGLDIGGMVDFNTDTFSGDRWIVNDKMYTIDFGEGFKVKPTEIRLKARTDFPARSEGAVIFASNDYKNWVLISDDMSGVTKDWSKFIVKAEYKNTGFRYFRLKDVTSGVSNKDDYTEDQPFSTGELRIFGDRYETINALKDVALTVQNVIPIADTLALPPKAVNGDTVVLSFMATEQIGDIKVTIQGESVDVTEDSEGRYTATYIVHEGTRSGKAEITIDYISEDGRTSDTLYAYPETFISYTDNKVKVSKDVLISNTFNEINVLLGTKISGSDNSLDATEINNLFDNKLSTFADVTNNSGSEFIALDFGADDARKLAKLDRFEILGGNNLPLRSGDLYVSASVDGQSWVTISEKSKGYAHHVWQSMEVLAPFKDTGFRYFRVIGNKNWRGNLSELRIFGEVSEELTPYRAQHTVTVKANNPEAGTTLVYTNTNGAPPASEPTGEASTLTVQDNQTAVTVVATPAEGYTFVRWVEKIKTYGLVSDYIWSEYPVFHLTTYAGGYLGGAKTYQVLRDWDLIAVFAKIEENPGGENPGGENPGGENPGGENPGNGNPGTGSNIGGQAIDYKVKLNNGTILSSVTADGVLLIELAAADLRSMVEEGEPAELKVEKADEIRITSKISVLGKSALVINTDFGSVHLNAAFLSAFKSQYGDSITINLTRGSLKLELAVDGQIIDYNDINHPITIVLPVTTEPGQNDKEIVAYKKTASGMTIFPMSVVKDGQITLVTRSTGTFDSMYIHKAYTDVSSHWAHEHVVLTSARGLFTGVGNDRFAPNNKMTRAMFVQVLAKLEGTDLSDNQTSRFSDVRAEQWYTAAVEWAARNEIVSGVGNGNFDPDTAITREQMALMLYHYIQYKGYELSNGSPVAFADSEKISAWAQKSVEVISHAGIIKGKAELRFDPQGIATRAEVSTLFSMFIQISGN